MLDFAVLSEYQENNRIEAKLSAGGLPRSTWETYSAFANTLGGLILLGVQENSDKSLKAVGIANPNKLIHDFWNIINNPNKVSMNILTDNDVSIEDVEGNPIIVINVPRARRSDRPIYIDGNPLSGSYRRRGEGDYKCTREEMQAMYRDAASETQDMLVLDEMSLDAFDRDSLHRYRMRMRNLRSGHVWEELSDEDFLLRIGGAAKSTDGRLHPTSAGLLMFGYEYEILREYPHYFLDYREQLDNTVRWADRVISSSGDWSGNLYDFYFRIYNKLTQDIKVPFAIEGDTRIDDTPVHVALREALVNCLVNADYYGPRGVVIIKYQDHFEFSNPGGFRIAIEDAKGGGVSDPRNALLIKMFNLISIGERAGSGIPNIYHIWKKLGWEAPHIQESFDPQRVKVTLKLAEAKDDHTLSQTINTKSSVKKVAIKGGDKKAAIKSGDKKDSEKTRANKSSILRYLSEHGSAKNSDIAALLSLGSSRTYYLLRELVDTGQIQEEGEKKAKTYRLISD